MVFIQTSAPAATVGSSAQTLDLRNLEISKVFFQIFKVAIPRVFPEQNLPKIPLLGSLLFSDVALCWPSLHVAASS